MLDGPLLGIDHAISPVGLSLDPEGFARLIRHFHANPGERALLATAPAADLLARAGVEVGSSGGP